MSEACLWIDLVTLIAEWNRFNKKQQEIGRKVFIEHRQGDVIFFFKYRLSVEKLPVSFVFFPSSLYNDSLALNLILDLALKLTNTLLYQVVLYNTVSNILSPNS